MVNVKLTIKLLIYYLSFSFFITVLMCVPIMNTWNVADPIGNFYIYFYGPHLWLTYLLNNVLLSCFISLLIDMLLFMLIYQLNIKSFLKRYPDLKVKQLGEK